jgi:hypothetical protein
MPFGPFAGVSQDFTQGQGGPFIAVFSAKTSIPSTQTTSSLVSFAVLAISWAGWCLPTISNWLYVACGEVRALPD